MRIFVQRDCPPRCKRHVSWVAEFHTVFAHNLLWLIESSRTAAICYYLDDKTWTYFY